MIKEAVNISVFTPSRTHPDILEAITVQRKALLDDAVLRIRESVLTKHKHHLLFVGPRGAGKTHMTTLIAHRLGQDSALESKMHVAWLNEDETCTTPVEFLARIFRALEKRYPMLYHSEQLEPVYEFDPQVAFSFLRDLLVKMLDGRTLLILVENLDAIFEALGSSGQKILRSLIQETPVFCIVATAQRLVNALSSRDSAFFGFFQTEHLKFLSVHEASELLQKIATQNEQPDASEFLATPRGESRVRALHHLSGGNHRVFIVLSQFITRNSIDSLVSPFLKMVDELTPYYQERLRWLPPMQRKIVELLCRSTSTVSVKNIAKPLFSTNQTIAKQLVDLREKGYVMSTKRGRESLYEISEPLMRICTEIKENQSPGPLALLVDFLRVWYDDGDMKTRMEDCDPDSLSCNYLTKALNRNREDGNLRKRLLKCSLVNELFSLGKADSVSSIESFVDLNDELGLAYADWEKGNADKALRILDALIDSNNDTIIEVNALLMKGIILDSEEEFDEALSALEKALLKPGLLPDDAAISLLVCASIYMSNSDEYDKAHAKLSAVLVMERASSLTVASALLMRSHIYWRQGEINQEAEGYKRIVAMVDPPDGDYISASMGLGCIAIREGRWESGVSSIRKGFIRAKEAGVGLAPNDWQFAMRIIVTLFGSVASSGSSAEQFSGLISLFKKYGHTPVLGETLIMHLGWYYKFEPRSNDWVAWWVAVWEPALAEHEEYQLVLRLLRVGARFLLSDGDESVLLELISAERVILRQAFGLTE